MVTKKFWLIGWRNLSRHPWQTILMITGIMLGVAVMVAIDLANASAASAFNLSTESIVGRATHQITGGPAGIDEGIYALIRKSPLQVDSAPIIDDYVQSKNLGNQTFQLLGIDPFAEPPFRDYLTQRSYLQENTRSNPTKDLGLFLTYPGSGLISSAVADQYNISPCSIAELTKKTKNILKCEIELSVQGQTKTIFVVGLINATDNLTRRALDDLILVDIATFQEITRKTGKLDRIDLIIQKQTDVTKLIALLPPSVRLEPVSARTGSIEQMTSAFKTNLTALSLLALIVGMFLIYNTMTFTVIQRRSLFGTLRCLGVTRQELFLMILVEAFIIGSIGVASGLVAGILLGQGAVNLVSQTINDLFFVLTIRGVQIEPTSLAKGAVLGILATLISSALPAWEAASVPPRAALSRSGLEAKTGRAIKWAALVGLGGIILGVLILLFPTRDLVVSFTGTVAIVIGLALLAPICTSFLASFLVKPFGRIWGVLGRMAPRNVVRSLSRTSIAVMALMISVSVTIGVSLMVSSFRHSVELWLADILQGDIYISSPGIAATQDPIPFLPKTVEALRLWPNTEHVFFLRATQVDSTIGPIFVAASSDPEVSSNRKYKNLFYPKDQLSERMSDGAVIISEPLANLYNLNSEGSKLNLLTDQGMKEFPIAGIFYDYSSPLGVVTMDLDVYQRNWDDPSVTAASVILNPGINPDLVVDDMKASLTAEQNLLIRPNRVLRAEVLAVFDRTFAITGALQLLATIVAFIGILSALLSLELERQKELGILRAVGLTVAQLWQLILLETGVIGGIAGFLSLPTGFILSVILIYVINRRSFGWTLQMNNTLEPFLLAMLISLTAAVLAGLYPANRIGKMLTSEAIRSE